MQGSFTFTRIVFEILCKCDQINQINQGKLSENKCIDFGKLFKNITFAPDYFAPWAEIENIWMLF
jgi:hypothetical protein